MKWAECIVLTWFAVAWGSISQPEPIGADQVIGMALVSPFAALMFLVILKAFVFLIIITSAPVASIIVRKCVEYHDKLLASYCEEPITFGKTY